MTRFDELKNDINNQNTDNFGVKGKWIKATKHSEMYNRRHSDHADKRGSKWWREVVSEYTIGNILIYKIGRYNWFVFSEFEEDFRDEFEKQKGIRIIRKLEIKTPAPNKR